MAGAMETDFGRLIFAGLVLSALGDALLLSARRLFFLSGMTAFGLAHILYGAAFLGAAIAVEGPFPWSVELLGVLLAALFGHGVMRRLWPNLLAPWRGPATAYAVVISLMLAAALGGMMAYALPIPFAVGAVLFAVSDISVARDRLTATDSGSRIWGLPLYFLAQLVIATSLLQMPVS